MNCHDFERRLEDLLEGRLDTASHQICLHHVRQCAACSELLEAVGNSTSTSSDPLSESLTVAVLEQTIGSACNQARVHLPGFVDGDLSAVDRQLVTLHLEGCTRCQGLADTLVAMSRELPLLAEISVDPRFTREVLAATLPRQSPWKRWWVDHWQGWVRRPRFAMEAAYVGLLVVMLVLGAFSTPLAALPQKGIELARPGPETHSVWTQTGERLGTFWDWFASLYEKTEEETTEETP